MGFWSCATVGIQTRRRQEGESIASLAWMHEPWPRGVRITRSCMHENTCAFLDTYCTPTDATSYLELCNPGKLKGLEENVNANGRKRDEIHALNFLIQLTVALCCLYYGNGSYMEQSLGDVGQIPGWETAVHTNIRPIKSSFRRRRTSGFLLLSRVTSVLLFLQKRASWLQRIGLKSGREEYMEAGRVVRY
jgi:hypothetical protein